MSRLSVMGIALAFVMVAALSVSAWGAEEDVPKYGWKNEVVGNFTFAQTAFDNWTQGGENTLAWQLSFNGKFLHLAKNREWTNSARLAYGMAKIGDVESRKSVDDLRFETVLSYKAGLFVDPYAAATAETQLLKGYIYTDTEKTQVSNFMDPAYFTQSVGVGRSYGDMLKSRVGFSLKETVTDKFPKPYADDPKTAEVEKTKVEPGMESVTDLSLKLRKNLSFASKLELFSNLEALDQVDVRWDNLVTAKVDKYVDVNLNVNLFYDNDISAKRQLKQALALGLTYSFM